jgi:Domain of unknown function (DUF4383)
MSTRTAALLFAIVFAVVGILGFMPSPPPPDAPPLTMNHGHGMALGIFPVNTLHNIVHVLFAVLGLAAWGSGRARWYFQVLAVSYALLAVLGLSAATNTTFGFIPIWGADVYLHAAVALGAFYFGFVHGKVDMHHHHPTPHRA